MRMSVSFGTVGGPTPAPAVGVVGGTIWRIVNFLRGDGRWAHPWPPAAWRAKSPREDGVSIAAIAIAMETNVCISVYGRSCCIFQIQIGGFQRFSVAFGPCYDGPPAACSAAAPCTPDAQLWLLSPTHTTNTTSPPNNGRRSGPERVRSSRRRVHVGRRPCVVVGGLPLTNTHNALPRWCLCDRHHPWCVCEGAGRPWTWLCGRRAAAEARRPTEAHTREEGRTSRMTKISELGCRQTPFR